MRTKRKEDKRTLFIIIFIIAPLPVTTIGLMKPSTGTGDTLYFLLPLSDLRGLGYWVTGAREG